MNRNYTQLTDYFLTSDGLFNIEARYFQPYTRGTSSLALLCHHCDIFAVNWGEYVDGLNVFCNLASYPHCSDKFQTALATQLLNGGAKSVYITTWHRTFNNWSPGQRKEFSPSEVARDAA